MSKAPGKTWGTLLSIVLSVSRTCNDSTCLSVMTSWTTCWSRSRLLVQSCPGLASPSTCLPSSSMASSWSSTASVLSCWVRPYHCRPEMLTAVNLDHVSVLEELHSTLVQLLKNKKSQKIDMDDSTRWEQLLYIHVWCLQTLNDCLHCFCQAFSGLLQLTDPSAWDWRSLRPFIWTNAHAANHAQSQYTDRGTHPYHDHAFVRESTAWNPMQIITACVSDE